MPASRTHAATPSGVCSIATPSNSSTSAAPDFDDADRLPCLQTGAPAAAVDDRGHRRHVDRMRAVTAGADDVDAMSARSSSVSGTIVASAIAAEQQPVQFVDRLALGSQRDDESGDLRRRGVAGRISESAAPAALGRDVDSGDERVDDTGPPAVGRERRHGWRD